MKDITLRDVNASQWVRVKAAATLSNTPIADFVVAAAAAEADRVIAQHHPEVIEGAR